MGGRLLLRARCRRRRSNLQFRAPVWAKVGLGWCPFAAARAIRVRLFVAVMDNQISQVGNPRKQIHENNDNVLVVKERVRQYQQ